MLSRYSNSVDVGDTTNVVKLDEKVLIRIIKYIKNTSYSYADHILSVHQDLREELIELHEQCLHVCVYGLYITLMNHVLITLLFIFTLFHIPHFASDASRAG